MDEETRRAVSVLRDKIKDMTDDDRMALVMEILEGYCEWCGSSYLPCYCMAKE